MALLVPPLPAPQHPRAAERQRYDENGVRDIERVRSTEHRNKLGETAMELEHEPARSNIVAASANLIREIERSIVDRAVQETALAGVVAATRAAMDWVDGVRTLPTRDSHSGLIG
jgi:hypothetical protein